MDLKWCTKLDVVQKKCPIVFRGHLSNFTVTRAENRQFESNLRLLGRSQLSNPSDLPCYTSFSSYWMPNPGEPIHILHLLLAWRYEWLINSNWCSPYLITATASIFPGWFMLKLLYTYALIHYKYPMDEGKSCNNFFSVIKLNYRSNDREGINAGISCKFPLPATC